MTSDQVLRIAAQHWYDRLIDGDASADWDGFDRDLEAALATVPDEEWRTVDKDGKTAIEGGSPDFGESTMTELDARYPDYAPFRIQSRTVGEWTDVP